MVAVQSNLLIVWYWNIETIIHLNLFFQFLLPLHRYFQLIQNAFQHAIAVNYLLLIPHNLPLQRFPLIICYSNSHFMSLCFFTHHLINILPSPPRISQTARTLHIQRRISQQALKFLFIWYAQIAIPESHIRLLKPPCVWRLRRNDRHWRLIYRYLTFWITISLHFRGICSLFKRYRAWFIHASFHCWEWLNTLQIFMAGDITISTPQRINIFRLRFKLIQRNSRSLDIKSLYLVLLPFLDKFIILFTIISML